VKHIVVFASGSGTNFQSLIDAVEARTLTHARISGLVTNNPNAGAIGRAKKHDIPVAVIRREAFPNDIEYERNLLEHLKALETDLIVLAGYLKKIPSSLLREYPNRVINIHPALLPKHGGKGFYGRRVHEAVIANNESVSGCTVHVVTEEYDQGPILGQRTVSVLPDDTPEELQKRVLEQEHQLLPEVIQQILTKS
jgi:formyltetrahydrofolate-dependent phosphoribosylglycinamide formyltransferase